MDSDTEQTEAFEIAWSDGESTARKNENLI